MKKKIAVDICNTIADVNGALEKEYGISCTSCKMPGLDTEWFINHLDVFAKAEPIPYSQAALNLLAEIYDIVYLTARPVEAADVTRAWLRGNGYPEGIVIYSTNKPSVFMDLSMAFAVDDAPHELTAYMNNGCKCYALARSYNQAFNNRFDWSQLLEGATAVSGF